MAALRMRLALALLTAATLLSACGRQEIAPEFSQLVSQFEADATARGVNVRVGASIRFGIPAGGIQSVQNVPVEGRCEWGLFGATRTIYIDRALWDIGLTNLQTVVLYHELGHCELNREHVEGVVSIMNAEVSQASAEFLHPEKQAALLDELFEVSK